MKTRHTNTTLYTKEALESVVCARQGRVIAWMNNTTRNNAARCAKKCGCETKMRRVDEWSAMMIAGEEKVHGDTDCSVEVRNSWLVALSVLCARKK